MKKEEEEGRANIEEWLLLRVCQRILNATLYSPTIATDMEMRWL